MTEPYDAVSHLRFCEQTVAQALAEVEDVDRRRADWAHRVLAELSPGSPLRVEGEILFPRGDEEAHAPDCAVAVNARHDCSCNKES